MTTGKKNHKTEAAIAALLTAPTIAEAAKTVGISEQTLWRWLQDEEFSSAYRKAKREAVSQAIAQLQRSTSEAVRTLQDVMGDQESPANARISAAKTMLEYAFKAIELEDLEDRIQVLEKVADQR